MMTFVLKNPCQQLCIEISPSHFHGLCLAENPSNQQIFARACPIAQHVNTV